MNRRSFGRAGECSAALYLESLGYEILGRNVYSGRDEIDIIAANSEYILFVEVKTRRQRPSERTPYGRPARAVTAEKQRHMIAAAWLYIHEHPDTVANRQPRLDVIEVYVDPSSDAYRVLDIEYFPGAVHR